VVAGGRARRSQAVKLLFARKTLVVHTGKRRHFERGYLRPLAEPICLICDMTVSGGTTQAEFRSDSRQQPGIDCHL
jgi:hypothetical protein